MAFFRFSRDKRGYEYFSLVEPVTNRRGKVQQRVLYWFRSPPGVKVGREPFDQSVRRALEVQNPRVTFDWPAILDAPIPSAEADKWRERRRAERAAKQAIAADEDDEAAAAAEAEGVESAGSEPARVEMASADPAPPAAGGAGDAARRKRRRRRGSRPSAPGEPEPPGEAPGTVEPHESTEPPAGE